MLSSVKVMQFHEDVTQLIGEVNEYKLLAVRIAFTDPDPYTKQPLTAYLYTPKQGYALHLGKYPHLLHALKPIFTEPKLIKVFHDGKRDLKFLYQLWGPDPSGFVYCQGIFDTYIASKLIPHVKKTSLKALCNQFLSRELTDEQGPENTLMEASSLLHLRLPLRKALIDLSLVKVAKLEFDLIPILAYMELTGIYLDQQRWEQVWAKWRLEQKALFQKVSHSLGSHLPGSLFGSEIFNPDSNQQVKEALQALGLEIKNVGENALKPYVDSYKEVADLLAYRQVAKVIQNCGNIFSQYIHPQTGRIHSHYEQIGAGTGRMSCSTPNIQQVPRHPEIRSCFTAAPGNKLIVADYSQVELRVAAAIAKDKRMLEAYRNEQDLHTLTASLILGIPMEQVSSKDRQKAKAVNFGLLYAMGARGLAIYSTNQYGVHLSLDEAQNFRDRFFQVYSGIALWHEQAKKNIQTAGNNGGIVRSTAGRIFPYNSSTSLSWLLNAPVQGGAAEVMKQAMIDVHYALDQSKAKIVGVVHDELLVECKESIADHTMELVKRQMEAAGKKFYSDVPFVSEAAVVDNWGEAK